MFWFGPRSAEWTQADVAGVEHTAHVAAITDALLARIMGVKRSNF